MSTKKRQQELQLLRDQALEAYLNREDFQYELNSDALYRQYKDRYQELGRAAMEDTMGQAAALTGGYSSSYAQNVGQQAYQRHLKELDDVIPELYQLAYDRYQSKGDALYQTYQAYDQQEKQAAEQLRWEEEQAFQKQQWQAQQQKEQKEQEQKEEEAKKNQQQTAYDGSYYAWLNYHQGKGQRTDPSVPNIVISYDNGNQSTGNIMTMQRVLGLEETGMWTQKEADKAGDMTADMAWDAYTKGKLQGFGSVGLGDMGVSTGNIRAMERSLRLKDDGYWSKADQEAAGGMTEQEAWAEYQKGHLQNRRS